MKIPLNIWIPTVIVAAGVALALYAHPRAYQVYMPETPANRDTVISSNGEMPNGRITGRVVWTNEIPEVPKIEGMMSNIGVGPVWTSIPNPATPRIDPGNRGIAEVVVYLKDVRPPVKPWPFPTLSIRITENRIALIHGETADGIGFVPVGSEVEIESRDMGYQMLRARGAAFFTLPLPRANQSQRRAFPTPGHVSLTSAIGRIESRAELFVCEHPYYCVTDSLGKFELTGVPPGQYEIVAWLKNWKIASKDRDPETGKLLRLNFEPPFIATSKQKLAANQTTDVEIKLP